MSRPDNPFAPPDPDVRASGPSSRAPDRDPAPEQAPFGAPTGAPQAGPGVPPAPAGRGSGGRDVTVLVLGILALISSFTIFGALAFGLPAVLLGSFARRRARAERRSAGFPVAGIALGLASLLVAGALLAYLGPDIERYQDCRRASFSVAQDKVCLEQLQRALPGG